MTTSETEEQPHSAGGTEDSGVLFNLNSLTCRYRKQVALDNISVELPAGKLIGVCGYSGSGKSTLLNTLGLLRYGKHSFDGTIELTLPEQTCDYSNLNSEICKTLRQEKFGFVLQSSYLLPNITGQHNIEMPLLIQEKLRQDFGDQVKTLLASLHQDEGESDLLPVLNRLPKEAAGGQRQRIAILRALIHNPSIVFADEPCSNLDPNNAESVMLLLKGWLTAGNNESEKQRDRTILLVSHDTESVIKFADKILVLRQGKIVEDKLFDRSDFSPDPVEARARLETLMKSGPIKNPTDR